MKRNVFSVFLKLFFAVLIPAMFFAACDPKEDGPAPLLVEDGLYIVGPGTALTEVHADGLMMPTPNEVGQVPRTGLVDIYIAVRGGAANGFNILKVAGGAARTFGPAANFAEVPVADRDAEEPRDWMARGDLMETNNKFIVPEDGLYHVIYDTQLNRVVVARVNWGIIGGATLQGWGGSTALPQGPFNLNDMTFSATNVALIAGEFKFRYGNGWKILIDGAVVRANTNFGGALNALVPGGANIANTVVGLYTVTVRWSLTDGLTATLTRTGDYTPPAFPSAMFLVGDATAYGWDAPGTNALARMIPLAGGAPNEGIFWKIAHFTANMGFKVSAANLASPNIGFPEVNSFDATAGAVTVTNLNNNMAIGTSGVHIIVLNLRDNQVRISVRPAVVFGIGDAFGSWDAGVAANRFTVDNTARTLTSPALPANGNIRMYTAHPWIPEWWQAEFRVNAGVIEFRGSGGDQAPVAGTAGQRITLNFDTNVGSITTP